MLKLRLVAQSRQPTLQVTPNTSVVSRPEITRVRDFSLTSRAAALDDHVSLTSVPARGASLLVIENADRPLRTLRDIHGDRIPIETHTARQRRANLTTTTLNDTHLRIRLRDARTGHPLPNRTLWLTGAAEGNVATNETGIAVAERRDLYVTASFPGATNVSRSVFYGPERDRVAFQPDPFNVYQLIMSLVGALVSVAAFIVFFVPFAYLRGGRD